MTDAEKLTIALEALREIAECGCEMDGADVNGVASDALACIEQTSIIDPRPFCIRCKARWCPDEAEDATKVTCDACKVAEIEQTSGAPTNPGHDTSRPADGADEPGTTSEELEARRLLSDEQRIRDVLYVHNPPPIEDVLEMVAAIRADEREACLRELEAQVVRACQTKWFGTPTQVKQTKDDVVMGLQRGIAAIRADQREKCAKIVDKHSVIPFVSAIAEAIRREE